MGLGTDIASILTPQHTVARDKAILNAVKAGHFVEIEWVPVPVSHKSAAGVSLSGTVFVSKHALRVGDQDDNFRPNVSHPTAQLIVDALAAHAKANAPKGVVLPTPKIMDAAAKQATIKVDPFLQPPGPEMGSTVRMLHRSGCIDNAIAGREGLPNQEGKGWVNSVRLRGRPELAANYGLYAESASYQGVLGLRLWQPGPGTRHISGIDSKAVPQGYTDYSQVIERMVRVDMYVDGRGWMDIREVAADQQLCWLISTEGPLKMRHPGVPGPGDEVEADPTAPARIAALPILTRTLRYGMFGSDVAFVQRVIGVKADGSYGPKTRDGVKEWQRKHVDIRGRALVADGVVGPATRTAILRDVAKSSDPPETDAKILVAEGYDPFKAIFRAARYFKAVRRSVVHWIVLHSAEMGEFPTSAEALQSYGTHMADGRRVSWNWAFDNDSGTRSVEEHFVAYHAGVANQYSVGYEHAGYARQTRAEWLDDYSLSMLEISARTAALYTGPKWDIPLDNVLEAEDLKRAYQLLQAGNAVPNELRGFTTHAAVSKGLGGTHGDPGKNFPMDKYLELVRDAA